MRTIEEIESNLQETELALKDAKEWASRAYDKYLKDKQFWGDGDFGETDAAHSVVTELTSKVNTLNWVLGIHP